MKNIRIKRNLVLGPCINSLELTIIAVPPPNKLKIWCHGPYMKHINIKKKSQLDINDSTNRSKYNKNKQIKTYEIQNLNICQTKRHLLIFVKHTFVRNYAWRAHVEQMHLIFKSFFMYTPLFVLRARVWGWLWMVITKHQAYYN